MNLFQFVPVKLTIFLVTGIVLGYCGDLPPIIGFLWMLIGISALAFIHIRKKRHLKSGFGGWAFFTTIGLGVLSISLQNNITYTVHLSRSDMEKKHIWKLRIGEQLKSTAFYHRYIARVESVDSILSSGLLLLKTPVEDRELKPGNRFLIWTKAKEVAPPKNPHQFNYRKYLKDQGISHQVTLKSNQLIKLQDVVSPKVYIQRIRRKIAERLDQELFGVQELGIIKALLLGDRRSVTENTYENYKNAGAVHILAVSGLHIGIILLMLEFLLKPLEYLIRGKQIKLVTIVLLLWSYAFLAGLSASVIRAVTMFTFVAYASYLNRPGIAFNVLALSAFFILLFIDPNMLFQVGFQLSYAAVLSILWAYPKIIALWRPKNSVLVKLWQLFTVGLAAQPGVVPLGLYYFNQFPGLFFISNITLVPFLGLVLITGFITVILSFIGILPNTLVLVYDGMITYMNSITAWVAGWEVFLFKEVYFDAIHLLLSYLLLAAIIVLVEKPGFRKLVILSCCVLLLQFWSIWIELKMKDKNTLIVFHQVGETILAHQQGVRLEVFSDSALTNSRLLTDYKIGESVREVHYNSIKNSYRLGSEEFRIVSKPAHLSMKAGEADIVLLSHSPRINLDRYLASHKPHLIIADGSNYQSFLDRWQKSCSHYNVPLHTTAKDGALELDLK